MIWDTNKHSDTEEKTDAKGKRRFLLCGDSTFINISLIESIELDDKKITIHMVNGSSHIIEGYADRREMLNTFQEILQ